MAQASVLTDTEIRRVFRMIETTRYAARNRLAFVLSIYAGLRLGEIAALTPQDVAAMARDGKFVIAMLWPLIDYFRKVPKDRAMLLL